MADLKDLHGSKTGIDLTSVECGLALHPGPRCGDTARESEVNLPTPSTHHGQGHRGNARRVG